jgi:hypothetical protein
MKELLENIDKNTWHYPRISKRDFQEQLLSIPRHSNATVP